MSDHQTLTDLQREIAAIQRDMEALADDLAGDPTVAKIWHILNDFGEKVDTWLHRESEGRDDTQA